MNSKQTPNARRTGIVVKKVDGETLIYDPVRNTAHCLNQNAALIWEHCDGSRSVAELIDLFNSNDNLNKNQKEQIVLIALNELAKSHLLENLPEESQTIQRLSRRQLIKAAGIAALIAIPVVSTMIAPSAAQASTCVASGQGCTTSAECCSGLCSVNICA